MKTYIRKIISIILGGVFLFSDIPYVYTNPQSLASRSIFKLWQEKRVSIETGLIIEARLNAVHKSILDGKRDPETLRAVDLETTRQASKKPGEFIKDYPFDYDPISFGDGRAIGIRANIYKDKYGEQQLILFYDPDNPPWDILETFGVKTAEDRKFAKRGYWVTFVKTPNGMGRRAFSSAVLAILAFTAVRCVWDTSGLTLDQPDGGYPDEGYAPDGGIIEQEVDAIIDNTNSPVAILQTSAFSGDGAAQRLSPMPQFVRANNAAFRYIGTNWHWALSDTDRANIINNGLTYIYNGRNHKLKLIGQDSKGKTRSVIFIPQTSGVLDYTQPYRVTISSGIISQLAQQTGLDINTFNIYFENLEPAEELVLNGFQKQYAVLTSTGDVPPDRISPYFSTFYLGGASVNALPTPQGINISYTMTSGNNVQSGGINIPTRSGGIDLADPSLQGAWKMDGANPGTDNSQNGNTLTNVNGVEPAPGRYGNAARFTAANESYLTIPTEGQTGLHITGDMTISAWINVIDFPRFVFVIAARQGAGDAIVDYTFTVDDVTHKLVSWNGNTVVFSDSSIPLGSWHHVALVREGNNITFYIDGEPAGTSYQEFPATDPNLSFYVGSNSGATVYANGEIDELAIFDRALTQQEIQGVQNQIDSSNFTTPALTTTEFKVRGNSPFILRLTDNLGQVLDVYILGLDPANWRSIIINILQAQAVMNPSFNLGNVASAQILVNDTFLPAQDGAVFNGTIDIQGLVGIPPTTRHRYATDSHDIDVTREDYVYLTQNLGRAETVLLETRNGIPVIGVTEWQDTLLQNGLGFTVNGRVYSAFTVRYGREPIIYIPHPGLIRSKLIKSGAIERRNSIILGHEIDEVNNPDHREAVFNEFSKNSINGLNYADVVTVLLETLFSGNFNTIDDKFHRQFIANLLIQGMFLDKQGNTYLSIIRETVDDRIDEDTLRQIYTRIIGEITGLVTSHRFTHKRLFKEETVIPDNELRKEPGFTELSTAIGEIKQGGTIYIDLSKFFVRNKSLASEDEVSTIDFEYLKRFSAFVRRLQGTNVKVKGIYSQTWQRPGLIEQLTSIIREDLALRDEQFPIQAVDFTHYSEFITDPRNTVSILTEPSWQEIPDRGQLKIVDSTVDRYNRVNSFGWEFYTALRGLSYDSQEVFLTFVIDEILQHLVTQRVITNDEVRDLKAQITRYGIAFIPTYFDPMQYYKTIESQKELLIAA